MRFLTFSLVTLSLLVNADFAEAQRRGQGGSRTTGPRTNNPRTTTPQTRPSTQPSGPQRGNPPVRTTSPRSNPVPNRTVVTPQRGPNNRPVINRNARRLGPQHRPNSTRIVHQHPAGRSFRWNTQYNRYQYRGNYYNSYQWHQPAGYYSCFTMGFRRGFVNYTYWNQQPWFNAYAGFYSPFRTYNLPTEWMLDYVYSDTLNDWYNDPSSRTTRYGNVNGQDSGVTLSQKQQLRSQIQNELNTSSISLDQKLNPYHIFMVSRPTTLYYTDNNFCEVTPGDLIQLVPDYRGQYNDDELMTVVSSKRGSCMVGTSGYLSLYDLQQYENDFNYRVDEAANELYNNQRYRSYLYVNGRW